MDRPSDKLFNQLVEDLRTARRVVACAVPIFSDVDPTIGAIFTEIRLARRLSRHSSEPEISFVEVTEEGK